MASMAIRYMQGGFWLSDSGENKSDLPLNAAQLEYTRFNTWLFRKDNLEFIETFAASDDFMELAEQYGDALKDGSERLTLQDIEVK